MRRPQDYLNSYRKKSNPDEMIDKLLEDPVIRRFVMEYDLTHENITQNINSFLTFKESKAVCQNCPGLFSCKLQTTGMTPKLSYYNGDVILEYTKCRYNDFDESKLKIKALFVPKKIFNAELEDFDLIGNERKNIHRYIIDFLKDYSVQTPMKGMYLSGIFGGGKTYILACIANELAKKGYNVIFAYYPDLVREIKSSIGNHTLESIVNDLKSIDMLFLDDFGGESPSSFIRDEVLGPLLQHRLLEEKPTFFSSNISMRVLKDSLAIDSSQNEKARAIRILERIKELAVEFEITEKPRI